MDSTLAKGLTVFDWMVRAQRECRLVDVARAHGLARSNAHRTLQTLVDCGWVVQNPATSAYRPSLRVFELGALVDASTDVKAVVRPCLSALAGRTGETIHLTVLEGAEIVYVDKFDSPLPVAAYSRIGGRAPAYCVASGKALLAALDLGAPALHALLGKLQAHTANTVTDADALQDELRRARQRGWAENREEWRLGVCGLGAAILDARGVPVAAVGMSVPSIRFARVQARALAASVLACARTASELLGYRAAAAAPARSTISSRRQA